MGDESIVCGDPIADVSPEAVRAEVERILASDIFATALRSRRLLAHLVDHTLAEDEHELKEYAIGLAVFDRGADFDPRTDSIVRVQVRRLRERLRDYYDGPGRRDPVTIEVPVGHYRARFLRPAATGPERAGGHVAPAGAPETVSRRWRWPAAAAASLLAVAGWWTWPVSTAPALPDAAAPPPTAIAVLPFDDLSAKGDHAWLAEGMAEDLIDALGRVKGLHVPARRSTSVLKSNGANLQTIGRRLGVGTVIEGSIRHADGRLTVVARWVRIDDRSQLWASRYDRKFEDVLAIQRDIAIGIAEAIRTQLGIQDAPASVLTDRYTTSDVRAWELYRKALALSYTLEPSKRREARGMLLRAIEYDPDYVAAHVRIAINDYYDDLDRGVEGLKAALKMDPYNPGALSTLAWDSAMRFWDYRTAERLLNRIPENERSAEALSVAFQVYSLTGRLQEALRVAERSMRFDPMWARGYCNAARVHELRGEVERARAMYQQGVAVAEETGQFTYACKFYFSVMSGRGRQPAGAQLVRSMRRRNLDPGPDAPCNPNAFARTPEEKAEMYECLTRNYEATAGPATTYRGTILRQKHAATRVVPLFMPHHDDPRFEAHIRRLDERMALAAGTYEKLVDLRLPE